MNDMLCGYRDDPRQWEKSEPEEEDTDPRTLMERMLGWLESEWQDALAEDSYDGWHDVRMMIYGASQSMVHSSNRDRFDDIAALHTLGRVAFEHSLRKIKEGTA